ncbi:hypothetical protein GCM10023081_09200 [Arthrobacter ginkgonis]|uniref:Flagellar protein FlgN n=1 Tax=Arthrobacter ginkgonis TaxID=1630594 RepID=A0ABP7BZT4_9MICC
MGAHELSAALWRQRELLEILRYKLEVEQMLLTAGKNRWINFATREVERVSERLQGEVMTCDVLMTALGDEWALTERPTLRQLAAAAPVGPWTEILSGHLEAITAQTESIRKLRDTNEQFLRSLIRSAQESAAASDPTALGYDSTGTQPSAGNVPTLDRTL